MADVRNPLISVLIPAHACAEILPGTVRAWVDVFKAWGLDRESWEIILAPNPSPSKNPAAASDQRHVDTERVANLLADASGHRQIRISTCAAAGKGAAIASAFAASQGQVIFLSDSDQPYDLKFFHDAYRILTFESSQLEPRPISLVTGNRRLPDSMFELPMSVLPYTYVRHLLGLTFNAAVRLMFPKIRTRDTQAGAKAMSRELAQAFFSKPRCPTFFFDVELFLTAHSSGFGWAERPVTLRLLKEESSVRFVREAIETLRWLIKIRIQAWRGMYRMPRETRVPSASAAHDHEPSGILSPDASKALLPEESPSTSPTL